MSASLCINIGPCAKVLRQEARVGLLIDVEPRMLIVNKYCLTDRRIQDSQNGILGLCPLESTICVHVVSLQDSRMLDWRDSVDLLTLE